MSSPAVLSVAEAVYADLQTLLEAPESSWDERSKDGAAVIHSRKSEDENCSVEVLRCRMILEQTDVASVLAMVSPWLPYRTQFDEMLQEAVILETSEDESTRLVRHVTKKKFPFSSRDSVDAVLLRLTPSRVTMVSRSVPNQPVTDNSDIVRTYQHLGSYHFYTLPDGNVQFEMYFQCDLNIAAPALIQKLIEKAKPKFMLDKAKSLKKALSTIKIDPVHLQKW